MTVRRWDNRSLTPSSKPDLGSSPNLINLSKRRIGHAECFVSNRTVCMQNLPALVICPSGRRLVQALDSALLFLFFRKVLGSVSWCVHRYEASSNVFAPCFICLFADHTKSYSIHDNRCRAHRVLVSASLASIFFHYEN